MAARLSAWLVSTTGRNVMGLVGTAIGCTASLATFLPHSGLINRYRDFVALRKKGERVLVPNPLYNLFEKTLEEIGIDEYHRLLSKPFMVFGFDVFNMGSLNFSSGGYIGLPINFTYESIKSIKTEELFIKDEPVNWNREDGQQLLRSLILSDNAKKYAIAREILMTDNYYVLFKTLLPGIFTVASIEMAAKFNDSLKAFSRPRAFRLAMYTLNGLFFWGVWCMHKDTLTKYYENATDKQIAEFGEDYIKGAIEYYTKTAERNIALRTLLAPEGVRSFKKDGDEITFIRQKHMAVSARKEFFEKKLEELKSEKEKESKNAEEIEAKSKNLNDEKEPTT